MENSNHKVAMIIDSKNNHSTKEMIGELKRQGFQASEIQLIKDATPLNITDINADASIMLIASNCDKDIAESALACAQEKQLPTMIYRDPTHTFNAPEFEARNIAIHDVTGVDSARNSEESSFCEDLNTARKYTNQPSEQISHTEARGACVEVHEGFLQRRK